MYPNYIPINPCCCNSKPTFIGEKPSFLSTSGPKQAKTLHVFQGLDRAFFTCPQSSPVKNRVLT